MRHLLASLSVFCTLFFPVTLLAGPFGSGSYKNGIVAADHPLAAEAGLEVLKQGGNAIDAAVATSFALSVVRPYSCGIGGGGFMLVALKDNPNTEAIDPVQIALNYREKAPGVMVRDYFSEFDNKEVSRFTGHAVGVPGTVAGLAYALEQFGTLSLNEVMTPAIRLAEEGFLADEHYVKTADIVLTWMLKDPARKERHAFVWERLLKSGNVRVGDRIHVPEQSRALRLIADGGPSAFYKGELAEALLIAVNNAGGRMTQADLDAYEVQTLAPLRGEFRGRQLLTMPPPSSGGLATIQILGLLERYEQHHKKPLSRLSHNESDYVHLVSEAMKHAFADRATWLGDPDFVEMPIGELLLDDYLVERALRIHPEKTYPPSEYGSVSQLQDDDGTSHLCVIDREGNAVSCTETINLRFGSRIAVESFGFLLNNEMDDFTTIAGQSNAFDLRQSELNLPAPGKRPLSSMSPTIVLGDDGTPELLAGAAGGPRIISGVVQAILNAMVYDMTPFEAVAAPRFHHQWFPNQIYLETRGAEGERTILGLPMGSHQNIADRFARYQLPRTGGYHPGPGRATDLSSLMDGLSNKGHLLKDRDEVAVVQLVLRAGKGYQGAGDPRKGGKAVGF